MEATAHRNLISCSYNIETQIRKNWFYRKLADCPSIHHVVVYFQQKRAYDHAVFTKQ